MGEFLMKKTLLTLSALTAFAANSLNADYYNNNCAPACDPCGVDFCNWDCLDGEFTLYGDWLFWKARRCDLNFAMTQSGVDPEATAAPSEFVGIKPKFESGYRIGGYYTAQEGFTLGVRYTHFDSHKSNELVSTDASFLVNRSHPSILTTASYADASYRQDYDMVDVEGGMTIPLGEGSKVYGFMSLRFGWLDEKMDTTYADTAVLADAAIITNVFEKNDIKSVGIGTGFELQKEIFCGFGFYARTLFSLMYADYDMDYSETYTEDAGVTVTTPIDTTLKGECILPVIELATGLQYNVNLCGFDIFATGGYEFVSWIGAKDFINFVDATQEASIARNKTNLGFEGFFVRLGATF